jgi:3D (Asp-Asp-Asp) domain-containing protein
MRVYNIAIHVLFWTVVILILSVSGLALFFENDKLGFGLPFLESNEIPEEEKIIVKEVREVKKEVDWFYFVASGYSANDPEQGTSNKTATGEEVKEGIIAVDPDIIPLGTKVEIKDVGVFVAEDTGGKIKGNRVDIYFNSKGEAKDFGRKGVWIRIISSSTGLELVELYGNVPFYENSF